MNIQEILNAIAELKVSQLIQLADTLEVSVEKLARNAVGQLAGTIWFAPDESKQSRQKIQFIKGIREQTQLGLKEAKEVSEGVEGLTLEHYTPDEIRKVKQYADATGFIYRYEN